MRFHIKGGTSLMTPKHLGAAMSLQDGLSESWESMYHAKLNTEPMKIQDVGLCPRLGAEVACASLQPRLVRT